MMKHQKLFSVSNKKGFTLIEVLISVSLLVLIFVFLYGQFNLAQLSTKKTTQIEKHTTKRAKIIELLYNDFMTASTNIVTTTRRDYDKIEPFVTQNSLYGIVNPFIKYVVVVGKESNILLRLESINKDINIQNTNSEYYIDKIVEEIKFFKVLTNKEFIEIFIQVDGMKDIYFKFKKVLK